MNHIISSLNHGESVEIIVSDKGWRLSKFDNDDIINDKFAGMIIGMLIGDACGCQYEFNKRLKWRGKIEHNHSVFYKRLNRRKIGALGQYSDDSEMSLILLRHILRNNRYDRDEILKEYGTWATSKNCMLGVNTRDLFYNAKRPETYKKRFEKKFPTESDREKQQSNGALMRCSPFILFSDIPAFSGAAKTDCELSNPSSVAVETNLIYLRCLQSIMRGIEITPTYLRELKIESLEIRKALEHAINKTSRFIGGKTRGWCIHSLYCAIYCVLHCKTFDEALHWLMTGKEEKTEIVRDSDTDTIAAISGVLIGALFGYKNMMKSSAIKEMNDQVLNVDTKTGEFIRESKYLLSEKEFTPLIREMVNFYKFQNCPVLEYITTDSNDYQSRTKRNVIETDGTLIFSVNFNTPGERLTLGYLHKYKKPYLKIQIDEETPSLPNSIKEFISKHNVKKLNIAGNCIDKFKKMTQSQLDEYVYNSLNFSMKLEYIQSGGQTGSDEAGIKAGMRLGIKTKIISTKDWKFRGRDGKDIRDETLFKKRFTSFL